MQISTHAAVTPPRPGGELRATMQHPQPFTEDWASPMPGRKVADAVFVGNVSLPRAEVATVRNAAMAAWTSLDELLASTTSSASQVVSGVQALTAARHLASRELDHAADVAAHDARLTLPEERPWTKGVVGYASSDAEHRLEQTQRLLEQLGEPELDSHRASMQADAVAMRDAISGALDKGVDVWAFHLYKPGVGTRDVLD
jgi:hypothetical protein